MFEQVTEVETNLSDGTRFTLGANVLVVLASRPRSILSNVAQVAITGSSTTVDQEGDENPRTDDFFYLDVGYGFAVEYWFSRNISLSALATTPLYTKSSSSYCHELARNGYRTGEESGSTVCSGGHRPSPRPLISGSRVPVALESLLPVVFTTEVDQPRFTGRQAA